MKKYTEQDLERIDILVSNTNQPTKTDFERFLLFKLREIAQELRELIVDKIEQQEKTS